MSQKKKEIRNNQFVKAGQNPPLLNLKINFKMIKIILAFISIISVVACASAPQQDKSARSTAAEQRIKASQNGADSVTKELDN